MSGRKHFRRLLGFAVAVVVSVIYAMLFAFGSPDGRGPIFGTGLSAILVPGALCLALLTSSYLLECAGRAVPAAPKWAVLVGGLLTLLLLWFLFYQTPPSTSAWEYLARVFSSRALLVVAITFLILMGIAMLVRSLLGERDEGVAVKDLR